VSNRFCPSLASQVAPHSIRYANRSLGRIVEIQLRSQHGTHFRPTSSAADFVWAAKMPPHSSVPLPKLPNSQDRRPVRPSPHG
jgi:hypothetical protein